VLVQFGNRTVDAAPKLPDDAWDTLRVVAPKSGAERVFGLDEWIANPANPGKARQTLGQLTKKYKELTGRKVKVVDYQEPSGSGALGEFIPETSEIILYGGGKHQLHQAAIAEELLHYFNYRGRGLLGKTVEEIGPDTIRQMEVLVERSLEKGGFVRFRPR
jgi:RNase P/RNase MRP subunit p29